MDDVDISHFSEQTDVTVRLIQAMVAGVHAVPALNAWFDGEKMALKILPDIHIGLAIDTEAGLFVPVLKNVNEMDEKKCRAEINALKQSAHARTLTPSQFQEATMSLSNFGMLAGRYANPIVVPPMVAILGCGRARDAVIVRDGKMEIGRILPLSLTVDHRAVTGGEATRFLAAVIKHLEEKKIV
jgi:pyruvate dehydrogenase E2 component (dihydrolipoamide acetyltransferase)